MKVLPLHTNNCILMKLFPVHINKCLVAYNRLAQTCPLLVNIARSFPVKLSSCFPSRTRHFRIKIAGIQKMADLPADRLMPETPPFS